MKKFQKKLQCAIRQWWTAPMTRMEHLLSLIKVLVIILLAIILLR